jgi:hypothetical protein
MAFTFTNGTTTAASASTSADTPLPFKQLAETYLDEFDQYGASYVQQKVRACLDGNANKLLEVVEEKVACLHSQMMTLQATHETLQAEHKVLEAEHANNQNLQTANKTLQTTNETLQKENETLLAEREDDRKAQVLAWDEMNQTLQVWKQKHESMSKYIQELEAKVSSLTQEIYNEKQYHVFRNRIQ